MFTCNDCKKELDMEMKVKMHWNICKPCKNERSKKDYSRHRQKRLEHKRSIRQTEHGQKVDMLCGARRRAKEKGIEFSLSLESIPAIPEYCPILPHIKIERGRSKVAACSPSLDRIDPTKGYVEGNVQIISSRANTLKSDGNLEEFYMIIEWFKNSKK